MRARGGRVVVAALTAFGLGLLGASATAAGEDSPGPSGPDVSAEASDAPSADAPATDPASGDADEATDPGEPELAVVTLTNGLQVADAPGPLVATGSTVTWTYLVANTGTVDLVLDSVQDAWTAGDGANGIRDVPLPDPPEGSDLLVLEPGDEVVLEATGTALAGQFENTVTASSTPIVLPGPPSGDPVTASDTSWYTGGDTGLTVTALVDGAAVTGPPGPGFAVGDTVPLRVEVTNTGSVALTDVALDVVGTVRGETPVRAEQSWDSLDPGQTQAYETSVTVVAGQLSLVAGATASSDLGPVAGADTSALYGGTPSFTVAVAANGVSAGAAPGPLVASGAPVSADVTVTNTGDTFLATIAPTITLAATGGGSEPVQASGSDDRPLAPGATRTFTADVTAGAGQWSLQADVTAVAVTGDGTGLEQQPGAVSATTWFQAGDAGLTVVKQVNGSTTDSAPGLAVAAGDDLTWTYTVRNTGTLPLTGLTVTDRETTSATDGPVVFSGEIESLAPGAETALTATGRARAGDYRNTVTVTGQSSAGEISAADDAYYVGGTGALTVTKQVAAADDLGQATGDFADSAEVPQGENVVWQVVVTNNGDAALTDLVAVDAGIGRTAREESLAPGGSITVLLAGTADADLENEVLVSAVTTAGEVVEGSATATLTVVAAEEVTDEGSATAEAAPVADDGGGSSAALWWTLGTLAAAGLVAALIVGLRRRQAALAGAGAGAGEPGAGEGTDGPPTPSAR
ncbi:hypothetical protein FH969_08040 [Miniimonas arenae]|uniref:DUF7507 domain-containing protein n=1 Tax=Miniimonas arenae TaxID=676201 RepID=A0A5C5BDV3_9MICO|nr:DUF11 domain-containing protein [Miniimonas arenae]TNU74085.1 hypothetical protein FH969_08040 [Miniimonas arenae]